MKIRILAIALVLISTGAEARKLHHQTASIGSPCVMDNDGHTRCLGAQNNSLQTAPMGRRFNTQPVRSMDTAVRFIPNPPGTWRVAQSCAHRLSAYWGLGKGLDKVSEWKKHFARASGPGPHIAAVRRGEGHVMGIVGGHPGAWQVVDFNSGGHLNRAYTVADFRGYFFLDTTLRIGTTYASARRHRRYAHR